jgi:hypothetical protein
VDPSGESPMGSGDPFGVWKSGGITAYFLAPLRTIFQKKFKDFFWGLNATFKSKRYAFIELETKFLIT